MRILLCLFCLLSALFAADSKLKVLVSVLPQKQMLERIGGEYVEVEVLVPSGKSPEIYEPSIAQMKYIQHASVFFGVGMPLESVWFKKFRTINAGLKYYSLTQNHHAHEAQPHDTHTHNPHIWLSPKNSQIQAEFIAHTLSSLKGEQTDFFHTRAKQLIDELKEIEANTRKLFARADTHKSFLVYHPAFEDFARDFQLEELSIEKDGKEAKGRDLSQLITQIKEKNIQVIFTQPQFSQSRVQSLISELQLNAITLDPLLPSYPHALRIYACQIAFHTDAQSQRFLACLNEFFPHTK